MTKKKIKDLARFEVFLWPELLDEKFAYIGCGQFIAIDTDDIYSFWHDDFDKEVEVLGKMVFQEKDKFGKEWVHNIYQNGGE